MERKQPKSGSKIIKSLDKDINKNPNITKSFTNNVHNNDKKEIIQVTPKIHVERDAYRFKMEDLERKVDSII